MDIIPYMTNYIQNTHNPYYCKLIFVRTSKLSPEESQLTIDL
jgi:hypothetical protein